MARIRTIKPEFWRHEALSALPEATHILAAALLNYSDDFGYFNANPKLIQAECSPLREPSVSIPESLGSLHECLYIRLGTGPDGRRYGQIVEFSTHQRVAHPTPSKIADIAITWDVLGNPPEKFVSPPETFRPEGNRERKGTGKGMDTTASVEAIKKIYPRRAGSQPWGKAAKAYAARLREGIDPDEISKGVMRYANYARETGKLNTEYVMQAATFLGPDKRFLESWDLPATKAETQQGQRVSAGLEWLKEGTNG